MDIKSKLIELNQVDNKASTEGDSGELLDKIFTLEDELLEYFGLPELPEFTDLLHNYDELITEYQAEILISKLKNVAEQYLISSPESDVAILIRAKDERLSAFDVLPLVSVRTHIYTIFIYEQYFLKNKESIENFLHIMSAAKDDETLNDLGLLKSKDLQKISELEDKGLKYVREFINF